MSTWTREHDAHIARECEGYEVAQNGMGTWLYQKAASEHCAGHWAAVPFYRHDARARDRAAEAWRTREECRWYTTESAANGMGAGALWPRATCLDNHSVIGEHCGPHALLWALYRATGGEE